MTKFCVRLAVLFCFFAFAGLASAEGFALYEYGARGIALGGAMTARKPDASAVAYNGALLTKLPGTHIMGGITAVAPKGKMQWANGDSTSVRDSLWALPHAYYTQQINERWFFGIGEFTRFGLGFEYPHDWPGRYNIYEVSLLSGSLNPTLAWKATDKLSLAAGVELVYVTLDLKKRVRRPLSPGNPYNMEMDSNIQDAEALGAGFNLAGHYQFNDQWALGLQYRSQVRVHAFGEVDFSYLGVSGPDPTIPDPVSQGAAAAYNANVKDGTAHATVVLPDSISGGIAWTPIPELSLEVGATWTRWSTFNSLNIHTPQGISYNPKHWNDVWRLNAGIEYQALDWLTLRAGYVWDQSPMTSRYKDYLVPTSDRQIFSCGLGFQWEAWTLDLGYAYIKPKNRSYRDEPSIGGGTGALTGTMESRTKDISTQLFSVSLGYEF